MTDSELPAKSQRPFLKWAGGKRWFVYSHKHLLPTKFDRYIEPFLGSAAVFFHIQPKKALLGDRNSELISTYQAIKDNWRLVYRYLKEHHRKHSGVYYYDLRRSLRRSVCSRAAQFIYLNRTCWNGLYRVNRRGEFNVPIGTKSSVVFDDENFEEISKTLSNADLYAADFEDLIDEACKGDFLFVDPPYTVRHNHNAFIKYNEKLFSWSDQERLFYALKRARARGAQFISTNAYHESVRELYEGEFTTHFVTRNSQISSKVESRRRFEELVITGGLRND